MRVLDLFSGIGGFSIGLERAGMRTVGFCEINPFCRAVLKHHWPEVPCADDIKTRQFERGEVDVICGGFPCQDISYAGRRAGLAGERSGLFWQLVRAVRVVRPQHVIVENVAALLTDGMGVVLGVMAADGYDAEWDCISANDIGAPHGRPRIWITLTDANREQRASGGVSTIRWGERGANETAQPSPNADSERQLQPPRFLGEIRRRVADGAARAFWADHWQAKFEALRGMDDGLPTRLDRDRDSSAVAALGNAVLPQIPEIIGRAILSS